MNSNIDLAPIIAFFDSHAPADEKKRTVYRIRWRGKYLVAPSGKTVWPTISGAKTAFNRFFRPWMIQDTWLKMFPDSMKMVKSSYSPTSYPQLFVEDSKRLEVIHLLQEQKLLEFVKIEG